MFSLCLCLFTNKRTCVFSAFLRKMKKKERKRGEAMFLC